MVKSFLKRIASTLAQVLIWPLELYDLCWVMISPGPDFPPSWGYASGRAHWAVPRVSPTPAWVSQMTLPPSDASGCSSSGPITPGSRWKMVGKWATHLSRPVTKQNQPLHCSAHLRALQGCSQPCSVFSDMPYSYEKMSCGPDRYASFPKDPQQLKGRIENKHLFPSWIHSASLWPSQLAVLCMTQEWSYWFRGQSWRLTPPALAHGVKTRILWKLMGDPE